MYLEHAQVQYEGFVLLQAAALALLVAPREVVLVQAVVVLPTVAVVLLTAAGVLPPAEVVLAPAALALETACGSHKVGGRHAPAWRALCMPARWRVLLSTQAC